MSLHAANVPLSRVTAAVLAGGKSSRFGSDKALAIVPGANMTFLARVIVSASAVASEVLLIAPDRPEYAGFRARLALDLFPGQGPVGGALTALKTATTDLLVVLSCDQPLIAPSDLDVLLLALTEHPAAAFLRDRNAFHPFPCAFDVSRCRSIANETFASGSRAMTELLQRCGTGIVDFPGTADDRSRLRDVDTPEDFQSIEAFIQ